MALELNGTTGVSLVQDGVITDANLPTGSVLQVVQGRLTTNFSSSSTSPVDIGLSASITPSSASNKILVNINIGGIAMTDYAWVLVLRNGTQIDLSTENTTPVMGGGYGGGNSTGESYYGVRREHSVFLDSPNSTSAIEYKVQGFCSYGTFYINQPVNWSAGATGDNGKSNTSSIVLMEIAG